MKTKTEIKNEIRNFDIVKLANDEIYCVNRESELLMGVSVAGCVNINLYDKQLNQALLPDELNIVEVYRGGRDFHPVTIQHLNKVYDLRKEK